VKFLLYSAENITAMIFGLVGAAMVARVFGPENMGRLSLVQAISAILMFLATFGLDHFVVREFTKKPDDQELKGTLLVAQSFGWVLYLCSILLYFWLQGSISHEVYLIMNVAISTYFLRVLYLKLYLQAINDAKSITFSAIISRIAALVFLVVGTIYHFSYDVMVMYLPLQAAIQALIMWRGYRQTTMDQNGDVKVSFTRMRELITEAMPVMLATALYYGYSQADVLIVSHFMNMHDVGIYSAAMRLVPQVAFLGHITVITFYSNLNNYYQEDKNTFISYATKIAKIQILMAIIMALVTMALSPLIIWALYGDKFSESSVILAIGVWGWVFMFPAALFSRLLVLTKIARFELMKAFVVAPVSLGLNFLLIPHYGGIAAASVSVLTFFVGDFLVYALFKDTRFMFQIGCEALKQIILHPRVTIRESVALLISKAEAR